MEHDGDIKPFDRFSCLGVISAQTLQREEIEICSRTPILGVSDQSDLTSLSLENQQFGILQKFVRVLLIYCHHATNHSLDFQGGGVSVLSKIYRSGNLSERKNGQPNIFLFCLIHVASPLLPWLTSGAQEFMTTIIVLFEPKASINSDRYG